MTDRPELDALIARAKEHVMTPEEIRAQKISFVFGQLMDAQPDITKEQIAGEHDRMTDDDLLARAERLARELTRHHAWVGGPPAARVIRELIERVRAAYAERDASLGASLAVIQDAEAAERELAATKAARDALRRLIHALEREHDNGKPPRRAAVVVTALQNARATLAALETDR